MGGRNTRTRVSEPIHGLTGRLRSVQRGSATLSGSPTDIAISSVVRAKAWENTLGIKRNGSLAVGSMAFLTSATNLRFLDNNAGQVASWEVIEEYA